MGMFDEVMFRCLSCGSKFKVQVKSGPCNLKIYDYDYDVRIPISVLGGLPSRVECPKCKQNHILLITANTDLKKISKHDLIEMDDDEEDNL